MQMLLNDLIDEYGEHSVILALRKLIEAVNCDDEPSLWAQDIMKQAVENNITDGTYPKQFATREQVVAMIMRAKFGKNEKK